MRLKWKWKPVVVCRDPHDENSAPAAHRECRDM
eukprot:CAMPEP_0196721870 /NCGR_PEP_ID=MMETSP1091-20130531/4343_1 /TAXON_ID=302021 /ORGANISM="Rhodomonas sp., Strain CCMP768" /LENGTH=32 /DNA_ID= /DNA_START= /DNA_END= /DNA_ORIENTATION=